MTTPKIIIPTDQLADFCRRWKIIELSLFGSVLRDDFGPDSDVDVLIAFASGTPADSWRFGEEMISELGELFQGRPIDLVERRRIINPFRRHEILTTREVVYAA